MSSPTTNGTTTAADEAGPAVPAAGEAPPTYGVWADLIGQEHAAAVLARAASGRAHAMSHAWLITGPPGSGRSNAARAFAAALQCRRPGDRQGCGECSECRTALSGAHPDVTLVRTEQLSIGVDEVRELVRKAAMSPTLGTRQVLIVEDADRMTERGADALLKSIEEPAPRTVWLLCAPTADDVVATIRSRCRRLNLRTPTVAAVERVLRERDGADPALAAEAARASQGHIGRARALVRHESSRARREEILRIPSRLTDLGACLAAAATLVEGASAEAATATASIDERETSELSEALGMGTRGAKPRQAQAALKALGEQQRARQKRFQRDALDRVLTELTAYYRDVLVLQTSSAADLVNPGLHDELTRCASAGSAPETLQRIDALLACRTALDNNVAPVLALEALLIELWRPSGQTSGLKRPKAVKLRR